MTGKVDYSQVAIMPDQEVAEWWEATKDGVFNVGVCNDCDTKFWPPMPSCRECMSLNTGLKPISGEGVIHSYIVITQPISAHMLEAVPYIFAIVELPDCTNPEGSITRNTRVHALVMNDEKDVGIGKKVKLIWADHPEQDFKMPQWEVTGDTDDVWSFSETGF